MPAPDAVERQAHWEQVYATRAVDAVSWFEPEAAQSFSLIQALAPPPAAAVIDIGGGASVLVDRLLDAGYRRPTVLDIADGALAAAIDKRSRKLREPVPGSLTTNFHLVAERAA